ncbi:MAG TPA: ABC transporter permease [Terriglobia bacterium]|nr:ABC transporter permease [Terriglobia bacterium]
MLNEFGRRLWMLLRRGRFDADLDEEMRLHRELREQEEIGGGLKLEEAHYAVSRRFGNLLVLREESRDMWGWTWLEYLVQDIRYGLRQLRRNPGFATVAVLTLALGIGANTAIFSVVNAVLLRPLPYTDAERLVALDETGEQQAGMGMSVAYLDFRDWQRENHSFTQLAAFLGDDFILTLPEGTEYLHGRDASADLFSVLGLRFALGRAFLPEEDRHGGRPVAIISHRFWQQHFYGSSTVLGQAVTLNDRAYTVVGVLPAGFRFLRDSDVYVPLGQADPAQLQDRNVHSGIFVIGRLKPEVTLDQARSDMAVVQGQIAQAYPDADKGIRATVMPLKQCIVGDDGRTLMLFLVAVGFVLLIACANVANLMLARSNARAREFAVRSALGARRARLIRQLLIESVLLGLVGGVLGISIAALGTRSALAAAGVPGSHEAGIDLRVLGFTLVISIFTGILFGLAPSLQSTNPNLQESLKEGARGVAGGTHRTLGILVIAETALTLVMLVAAGLMVRTIHRLWATDPGFDAHDVFTFQVVISPQATSSPEKTRIAFHQLLEQVRNIPGVDAAGLTNMVPLGDILSTTGFWLGPQTTPPAQPDMNSALLFLTTPGYLRALKIPLLRGRLFGPEDTLTSLHVVLVDNVFVQKFLPGTDPLGTQISLDFFGRAEIVGVVGHVKHYGLASDAEASVRGEIYFPFEQIPDKFMNMSASGMTLVVRSHSNPVTLIPAVRRAVMGPWKDQPVFNVQTMEQVISTSIAGSRSRLVLLGTFAGIALLLAAVGIYGVVSYSVGQRAHEMGIRMALGARRLDVLRLVVGQGFRLALIGVLIGIIGAIGITRFLSNFIYGVRPTDPLTFVAVSIILCSTALLASFIPARRATKVDPMVVLRYE